MQKGASLLLIYAASWCYVIASYYHLSLKQWSFGKAMIIALPLVVVEYTLSLHGNKQSNSFLSPLQILIFTFICYVVNILVLNVLVLKQPISPVRDAIAVALIVAAIVVSTNTRIG
ncbi:DMT family protein [Candidatus Saccharibacteria bacterium]|nr:DMT family protein [Candidatus Saccharibacteria bacterium]